MKKCLVLTMFLLATICSSKAQIADSTSSANYLRVFVEGAGDWDNYIKVKLWYVDYVRDPKLAQVQVIISSQPTAAGGDQYYLFFVGRTNYTGKNDTLKLIAPLENTNRKTRDELTNVFAMGLMPYLARNNQHQYMEFDYTNRQKLVDQSIDKWKNWVYTTSLNSNLTGDQAKTLFAGDGSFSAARITDKWKERFTAGVSITNSSYETATYSFDGNTIVKNLNALIVRSINQHWSIGVEPAFYASSYSNVKAQYSVAPGVEYNVFPYYESINHLFTFKYRLQPLYRFYNDTTVFFKNKEFLLNQIADVTYTRIEKWGNLSLTLTASHFINHPKAYRVDLIGQMNFRLAKGLFFNVTGNASLINNQLSISKTLLKSEQILLQQKEILSNYSYGIQIGIRYVFGSIYNNIVNPRYDGGININPEVVNVETAD